MSTIVLHLHGLYSREEHWNIRRIMNTMYSNRLNTHTSDNQLIRYFYYLNIIDIYIAIEFTAKGIIQQYPIYAFHWTKPANRNFLSKNSFIIYIILYTNIINACTHGYVVICHFSFHKYPATFIPCRMFCPTDTNMFMSYNLLLGTFCAPPRPNLIEQCRRCYWRRHDLDLRNLVFKLYTAQHMNRLHKTQLYHNNKVQYKW